MSAEGDETFPEPIGDIVEGLWHYVEDNGLEDCSPDLSDLLWDQWVVAVIACTHGKYRGTSRGFHGFTEAVSKAADRFRESHPPAVEATASDV